MSERDPRVDPKPGDVLRKGRSTVTVKTVGSLSFGFDFDGYASEMPPSMRWDQQWKGPWRKWAKDAEVITRAEDHHPLAAPSPERAPASDRGVPSQEIAAAGRKE